MSGRKKTPRIKPIASYPIYDIKTPVSPSKNREYIIFSKYIYLVTSILPDWIPPNPWNTSDRAKLNIYSIEDFPNGYNLKYIPGEIELSDEEFIIEGIIITSISIDIAIIKKLSLTEVFNYLI